MTIIMCSLAGHTISPACWMYGTHITSDWRKRSGQISLPILYYNIQEIPGQTTSELSSPSECGWNKNASGWDICWTTLPEASKTYQELQEGLQGAL